MIDPDSGGSAAAGTEYPTNIAAISNTLNSRIIFMAHLPGFGGVASCRAVGTTARNEETANAGANGGKICFRLSSESVRRSAAESSDRDYFSDEDKGLLQAVYNRSRLGNSADSGRKRRSPFKKTGSIEHP